MSIYVIERHQGDHYDYRVISIKAFKDYYKAKEFFDLCNENIKPLLDKMEVYNKKYGIGYRGLQEKFNNVMDMMSDKEYREWEEKMSDEYNKILETFEHDELEFADTPINYKIKALPLI